MLSFFCIVLFHRKHELYIYMYMCVHICIYLYKQEKICLNKARSIKSWLLSLNKVSTLYLSHSVQKYGDPVLPSGVPKHFSFLLPPTNFTYGLCLSGYIYHRLPDKLYPGNCHSSMKQERERGRVK